MTALRGYMIVTALAVLLILAGCAQVAYDSLRQSQVLNCQQMPGTTDRDECMRRSGMSYEEYQRQLDRQKPER